MALVNYDIDDWEMPGHQRRALLQRIQISTEHEYDTRARAHWNNDIQYDQDHWEEIVRHERKKAEDARFNAVQIALKIVRTTPKRKARMSLHKSYNKELAKYNAAIELLREEGYNILEITK